VRETGSNPSGCVTTGTLSTQAFPTLYQKLITVASKCMYVDPNIVAVDSIALPISHYVRQTKPVLPRDVVKTGIAVIVIKGDERGGYNVDVPTGIYDGIRREFFLCLLWRRIHAIDNGSILIGRDFSGVKLS